MKTIELREIHRNKDKYLNNQVEVAGWVKNNRDSKNFGFLVISDGTFFEPIQVVYSDTLENFSNICKINIGAAVIVKGKLVPTPEAKQPYEIQAESIDIEGDSI